MPWNGNECGRKYKVMRITRQASTIQIIIDQKQLENVEYFKYMVSMMTYDAKCTLEIKSRIAMTKEAFNKQKAYFTSKVDLKFKEETSKVLHLEHIFLWC